MQNYMAELVHLQLTRKCNLRCKFCGQWGEHGFACSDKTAELQAGEWLDAIDQIQELNAKNNIKAKYILWGGEPLMSPVLPIISKRLHDDGCGVAVITNGTLLKNNSETINKYVDTLYISIDGPKDIHEHIRGQSGIYNKIKGGMLSIDKDKIKTVGMFTICEDNYRVATEFPHEAKQLGFSKLVYQNLIYCSSSIADKFKNWLYTNFNIQATAIDSWTCDNFKDWVGRLPDVIKELKKNTVNGKYPLEVKLYPESWMNENIINWFDPKKNLPTTDNYCCELPWKHLHIRANGNVDFCVDYSDFVLGNIKKNLLSRILESMVAQKFRNEIEEGNNPLCKRCPWYYNKNICLD